MIKNKKRFWFYLLAIFLLLFTVFRYTAPLRMVGHYKPEYRYYVDIASKDNVLFILQLDHIGYPYNELLLFDASVPNKPSLISKLEFAEDINGVHGITINSDYLYIVTQGDQGVLVVDISNLEAPRLVTNFAPPADGGFGSPLIINNDIGYVETILVKEGERIHGLLIVSLQNPQTIKQLSFTPEFGDPFWLSGNYLYIEMVDPTNSSNFYLSILDVSDPKNPIVIKEMPELEDLTDAYADGSALYISSWDEFIVADVSDPVNPAVEKYPWSGNELIVEEKTVFFIKSRFHIYAVDFSDGRDANIIFDDRISQGVEFTKVGDYIYVADQHDGLLIYKINHNVPAWRNSLMTTLYEAEFWILDKIALVAP